MDLRALRCFITVLEAGSLSRAASSLYIAQPALTAQIKKLEAVLGRQVSFGAPISTVAWIRAALETALKQPQVIAALEEQGGQVLPQDSEAFTRAFSKEMAFTEAMMSKARLEPM